MLRARGRGERYNTGACSVHPFVRRCSQHDNRFSCCNNPQVNGSLFATRFPLVGREGRGGETRVIVI